VVGAVHADEALWVEQRAAFRRQVEHQIETRGWEDALTRRFTEDEPHFDAERLIELWPACVAQLSPRPSSPPAAEQAP
jgi:hypothetical protein